MLFLTFQIGNDRYALDTQHVVEVLPLVQYKVIPGTADGVAGVFNYHGKPVPLIDLTKLSLGKTSDARMSTRIILVSYAGDSGNPYLFGLIAEHVTETVRRNDSDFVDSGVNGSEAGYLGPVTTEGSKIIQRVDIRRIVPENVLSQLSRGIAESG